MKKFLKNNWQIIFLAFFSFLTRFIALNYPASVVFDEVWFGQFVQAYFSHKYYFDIHPPLGKLMIFWFSKIIGFAGQLDFSKISNAVNSQSILTLRFLPALAGALFVILIYFLILRMKLSKRAAFLGACLVLFDNAILAQSKFVLMDIFQLFFGFLSLYFLICWKDFQNSPKKSYWFLAGAAGFSALAFSIKWTGISFLAIILLCVLIDAVKNPPKLAHGENVAGPSKCLARLLSGFAIVVVLPFLIYFSFFVAHFNLLYKSGPGDAYMSQNFAQANLWDKFSELNQKMYFYNSTLNATHPYSSKWYQWPLGKRPIWYWSKSLDKKSANIYLIGNPVVWWTALLAVIASVVILLFKSLRKTLRLRSGREMPIFYILVFGYFLNLLPFMFISRIAFLYHYFSSLVFGILIFAFLYDKFSNVLSKTLRLRSGHAFIFYFAYLSVVILVFLLILPLTYGIPVSAQINNYYNYFVKLFL